MQLNHFLSKTSRQRFGAAKRSIGKIRTGWNRSVVHFHLKKNFHPGARRPSGTQARVSRQVRCRGKTYSPVFRYRVREAACVGLGGRSRWLMAIKRRKRELWSIYGTSPGACVRAENGSRSNNIERRTLAWPAKSLYAVCVLYGNTARVPTPIFIPRSYNALLRRPTPSILSDRRGLFSLIDPTVRLWERLPNYIAIFMYISVPVHVLYDHLFAQTLRASCNM